MASVDMLLSLLKFHFLALAVVAIQCQCLSFFGALVNSHAAEALQCNACIYRVCCAMHALRHAKRLPVVVVAVA